MATSYNLDDNSELADAATLASILRERYSRRTINQILNRLRNAEADLLLQIEARIGRLTGADRRRFIRDDYGTQRLVALRDSIIELTNTYRQILNEEVRDSVRPLVDAEVELAGLLVNGELTTGVSAAQVHSAAVAQPFNGAPLREYVKRFEVNARRRVLDSLRSGFVLGETPVQLRKRVESELDISKRGAAMVARTTTTHFAARSHLETYRQLGVRAVRLLVTLDGFTSKVCQAHSAARRVYDIDDPKLPIPSFHPNCRTVLIPVTGEELTGTRASETGQVPAKWRYDDWLERQPVATQREILGATNYKLWKDGGLSLEKFVDLRKNRAYTIAELRQRYAGAFNRAGITQSAA